MTLHWQHVEDMSFKNFKDNFVFKNNLTKTEYEE